MARVACIDKECRSIRQWKTARELEQFTIGCGQKLRRAGQAERRTRAKAYLEDDLSSERDEVLRRPPQADSGHIRIVNYSSACVTYGATGHSTDVVRRRDCADQEHPASAAGA